MCSDADARAPHVREADSVVRLPGDTPTETYLRADLVIAAARRSGADAVHPGYGFLSENAEFARAVQDAGLTWIGPSPESIEVMGSKARSKELMHDAEVPVLEALRPEDVTADHLPVLVKASAGGGGRGMRVVEDLDLLEETIESAAREAASAFGDPTILCERYLPRGHHVEVQVFGDHHGTVWAIGERECSLQRRHQKVVEEAPSPLVERVGGDMRERLFTAARNAAAAVDYVGAGTVEFLADENGEFYFLEMNTRLQVEHPVTECTTGLDLVDLQLRVASGEPLPEAPPASHGHAIEVRLYAEDPDAGWQPQSGPVHTFDVPRVRARFEPLTAPGIRVDAGVEAGSVIGTDYDPMIAKVIGVAPDRRRASALLAAALADTRFDGPTTNRDLLVRTLRDEEFLTGVTDTQYFGDHPEVFAPLADDSAVALSALAAALAQAEAVLDGAGEHREPGRQALHDATLAANPRPRIRGWRLFQDQWRIREFTHGEQTITASYRWERTGYTVDPTCLPVGIETVSVGDAGPDVVVLEVDGVAQRFTVTRGGEDVFVGSPRGHVALREEPRFVEPGAAKAPGSLLSPMPGTVLRVAATVGAEVAEGDPLVWIEAMKMEHTIRADRDGVVTECPVTAGERIDAGVTLVVIEANGDGETDEAQEAVA
ncbi:biotin carboxylase N-terminal domain-containing protein [Brevibacterium yomogidense]